MKFETERLIIRKPTIADSNDIFRNYSQDSEVTRYLSWMPHDNIETTKTFITECIESWDINQRLPFVLWHKDTRQTIGMIDFEIDDHKMILGFVLAKSFWNMGLMTEAAEPMIKLFLEWEGIYRIESAHDTENPASGRVMEKLGMEYEGVVRKYFIAPAISDVPRDCKMYAIVKQ